MTSVPEVGEVMNAGNVSGTFICIWKLFNFSKLDYACEKPYSSPVIYSCADNGNRWFLKIYPGGYAADCKGFISLYLCSSVDYKNNIKVKYVIDLRSTEDRNIVSAATEYMNFSSNLGYPKLIERTLLLSELIDDALIIQVKTMYTQSFITDVDGETESYPEINSELIGNDMIRLQTENIGTDVVISVGRVNIPAHFAVLAVRSKELADMSQRDTEGKSSRRIFITDFDVQSVRALLQFIYSGSFENPSIDLAMNMLRAADKYHMDDLKIYCSNYLISRIDIYNIGEIAVAADVYNAAKLRGKAVEFICDCKREFNFEKYASVLMSRSRLLLDITKRLAVDTDN